MRAAGVAAVCILATSACSHVAGIYTYEGKKASGASGGAFSAESYVEGIWASKLVPTVTAKAVDAGTLLPALSADSSAAGKKYGVQNGVGSPYAFLIKGSGSVTKVDTTDPTGPITVKLTTGQTVTLDSGPVLIGTALRDAVGFIDFSAFTNQIDYADVATAINTKVKNSVIAGVKVGSLTGKTVTFAGAFSVLDPTAIVIIPAKLSVGS